VSEDRSVIVAIVGLECFGRHGVYPAERQLGERFVVDLEIEIDDCPAVESDQLKGALDYAVVADDVAELITGTPVSLIEHLAELIAQHLMKNPLVDAVTVTVHKPHVALRHIVAEAAVTVRRERKGR
jgi:7,8-dihydroneopterin aldolase/epimerase/oxygenase